MVFFLPQKKNVMWLSAKIYKDHKLYVYGNDGRLENVVWLSFWFPLLHFCFFFQTKIYIKHNNSTQRSWRKKHIATHNLMTLTLWTYPLLRFIIHLIHLHKLSRPLLLITAFLWKRQKRVSKADLYSPDKQVKLYVRLNIFESIVSSK